MTAVASLNALGDVTLGVNGKPLKPPEIVGVINSLRSEVDKAKARVDALMEENTKLRRDERAAWVDEAPTEAGPYWFATSLTGKPGTWLVTHGNFDPSRTAHLYALADDGCAAGILGDQIKYKRATPLSDPPEVPS